VLDRKLGIPITLSVLTMEVGRRVGIDIAGVGLPGHFIVSAAVGGRSILFDPFHGGRILTPEECEILVQQVIDQLRALGVLSVRKLQGVQETVHFPLPMGLGDKSAQRPA